MAFDRFVQLAEELESLYSRRPSHFGASVWRMYRPTWREDVGTVLPPAWASCQWLPDGYHGALPPVEAAVVGMPEVGRGDGVFPCFDPLPWTGNWPGSTLADMALRGVAYIGQVANLEISARESDAYADTQLARAAQVTRAAAANKRVMAGEVEARYDRLGVKWRDLIFDDQPTAVVGSKGKW